MRIDRRMRVDEIVRALPNSPRVFSDFHVNHCCGGERTVGEICREHGIDFKELAEALERSGPEEAPGEVRPAFDPRAATATDLIAQLLDHHHVDARRSIATVKSLLPQVLAAHKDRHPELERIAALFEALVLELSPHMQKEESHAFPAIVAAERGLRDRHGLDHAVRILRLENELVGELLDQIRASAEGYRPPEDACPTLAALYRELAAFDRDLVEHVNLENDYLLPLVQAIVQAPTALPR